MNIKVSTIYKPLLCFLFPGVWQLFQKRFAIAFFQLWTSISLWFILYWFTGFFIPLIILIFTFHLWSMLDIINFNSKDTAEIQPIIKIESNASVFFKIFLLFLLFVSLSIVNIYLFPLLLIVFIWTVFDTIKLIKSEQFEQIKIVQSREYHQYPDELIFIVIYTLIQGLDSLDLFFYFNIFHFDVMKFFIKGSLGALSDVEDILPIVVLILMKKQFNFVLTPTMIKKYMYFIIVLAFASAKGGLVIILVCYGLIYIQKWALNLIIILYIISIPVSIHSCIADYSLYANWLRILPTIIVALPISIAIITYLSKSKNIRFLFNNLK